MTLFATVLTIDTNYQIWSKAEFYKNINIHLGTLRDIR